MFSAVQELHRRWSRPPDCFRVSKLPGGKPRIVTSFAGCPGRPRVPGSGTGRERFAALNLIGNYGSRATKKTMGSTSLNLAVSTSDAIRPQYRLPSQQTMSSAYLQRKPIVLSFCPCCADRRGPSLLTNTGERSLYPSSGNMIYDIEDLFVLHQDMIDHEPARFVSFAG